MGTFERIRKTSPYFLALFAVMFIGFMVLSDANITDVFRKGQSYQTAVLASVNGHDILYKDYEEKVKDELDRQREQAGDQAAQIDDQQIRRTLWSQMMQEVLLGQEAEKAGLFVSDDEIRDIMLDNPPEYLRKPFTDSTGNFNKAAYLEIVTKPEIIMDRLPKSMSAEEKKKIVSDFRRDIMNIEKSLRDQLLNDKMRTLVNTSDAVISPLFAETKYKDENSSANVSFIYLDANQVPDNSVKVGDDEIQKYYDSHKEYYPQKPSRKLKYVVFPLVASDKDSANAGKIVRRVVEDLQKGYTPEMKDSIFNKKLRELNGDVHEFASITDVDQKIAPYITMLAEREIAGPVSMPDGTYFIRLDGKRSGTNEIIKASHILVNFGDNKDSAKAFAQTLIDRAKKEDFATLARTYSEDKGSAQNGGDLGFFGKGRMVKPFEEAAFAASVGSVVGPVESQFGYHVIKVTDKKSEEIKYSVIKISPTMSRMTTKIIGRDATGLKIRHDEGATFENAAKYYNKPVRETNFFEANKPVLGSLYLNAKAFAAKPGEVLEPVELKNIGIVVAQVSDVMEEGFTPLKALKDQIRAKLVKAKKLDALKSKAQTVYGMVKGLDSLTKATTIDPSIQVRNATNVANSGFVPGLGQDYVFSGTAYKLPVGKISEPVRGEMGWFVMQVTNRTTPQADAVKRAIGEYMNTLTGTARSNGFYEWFSKIMEEADLKDNRAEHYKEY